MLRSSTTERLDLSVIKESFESDRFMSLPFSQHKRHWFTGTFTLDVDFRAKSPSATP